MHTESIAPWTHQHVFLGAHHGRNERRTWVVVALTAAMMVAEIVGGVLFGSMALLADGWHMSTHAAALAISALAYLYARRHAHDPRYAFGTGKLGELAGFASAVVLGIVALLIGYESLARLAAPVPVAYGEAIAVAALGLAVNVISAWLLRDRSHDAHGRDHNDHGHAGHHHHGNRDHNLRSAYLHVLADAATSVLAIGGLLAAMAFDFPWIDALVGLVGACVIAVWSLGLIRDSGRVLLDIVPDPALLAALRQRLEAGGDRVADLHLWQVGPGHRAAVVSIVSDHPMPPAAYKQKLAGIAGLSHVTVEVEPCRADEAA
ncbi:MAG: CDF family Co(II)/Ni(II) efflux transporter DmeF [Bauldia sp.]